MAREKKPVHKVQMTDGQEIIIQQLLQEYDIQQKIFKMHLKIVSANNHTLLINIACTKDRCKHFTC